MKKFDYDYVFTFIVPLIPFFDNEEKVLNYMNIDHVKGYIMVGERYVRVLTVGSTRREAERLMYDLRGKNLRSLDFYTYRIMVDYIGENVLRII